MGGLSLGLSLGLASRTGGGVPAGFAWLTSDGEIIRSSDSLTLTSDDIIIYAKVA